MAHKKQAVVHETVAIHKRSDWALNVLVERLFAQVIF